MLPCTPICYQQPQSLISLRAFNFLPQLSKLFPWANFQGLLLILISILTMDLCILYMREVMPNFSLLLYTLVTTVSTNPIQVQWTALFQLLLSCYVVLCCIYRALCCKYRPWYLYPNIYSWVLGLFPIVNIMNSIAVNVGV